MEITPQTSMNTITVGDAQNITDGGTYSGWCYPVVEHYYPQYITTWTQQPSKIEQSFKIVNALIKKKLVKLEKVKDFIELVSEISKVI